MRASATYNQVENREEQAKDHQIRELDIRVEDLLERLVEFVRLALGVERVEAVVEASQSNHVQCRLA